MKYLIGILGLMFIPNAKAADLLCVLVAKKDIPGIEAALNAGADLNTKCASVRSSYTLFALTIGYPNITALLIDKGVNPASASMTGGSWGRRRYRSNFDIACATSLEATKAFLNRGVNPETVDGPDSGVLKRKPLGWALFGSSIADMNLRLQISDLLISKGASPFGNQYYKESQLSFLISETIFPDSIVLEKIKNWNFQGDQLRVQDYLDLALQYGRSPAVIEELKAKGGNLLAIFGSNHSAISLYLTSYRSRNIKEEDAFLMINWLLKEGVSPNGANGYALNASNERQFKSVTKLLLEAGVDVNKAYAVYWVARLSATPEYQIEVTSLLLKYGADINLSAPLVVAIEAGNTKLAKYLIKNGANVNLSGAGIGAPICAARWNHDQEMIDFLKSKGAVNVKCWFDN